MDLDEQVITAIFDNRLDLIKQLVNQNNINNINYNGSKPLSTAIRYDRLEIVLYLIEIGVDLAETETGGYPPLIESAKRVGNIEITRALLIAGADVNTINEYPMGMTILHYACAFNNIELARLALDHGVDISIIDYNGKEAIFYARCKGCQHIVDMIEAHQNEDIKEPEFN
jgi:ankyrin repeat protein